MKKVFGIFLLFLQLVLPKPIDCQSISLFTKIDTSQLNLTQQQKNILHKNVTDSFTMDYRIVEMIDPILVQQNGRMNFSIPDFETGNIQAEAVRVVYNNPTDYIWSAKLLNRNGYMSFVGSPNGKLGFIQIDNNFYEITPLEDNIELIIRKNNQIFDPVDCLSSTAEGEDGEDEEDSDWCISPPDCPASIDILLLIPPDANDYLQNKFAGPLYLNPYLTLGIESVNLAFKNSGIVNKEVRYNAVSVNFPYINSPLTLDLNLDFLSLFAASLREQYKSDLVVLLTSKDMSGGAGIANVPSSNETPQVKFTRAFSIVELPWLINPRWTFAHEVGHLLGGRHSRPLYGGDDNNSSCGHGWTIGDNNFQRSIMAPWFGATNNLPADIRVLHFSNPDIIYNSSVTGTDAGVNGFSTSNNNSKVIRNSACEVANYNQSQQFDFWIDAPLEFCYKEGEKITLNAILQLPSSAPLGSPYFVSWHYNQSGVFDFFNPGTPIGNALTQDFTPPSNVDFIFIHLAVFSSSGEFYFKTQKINIKHDCFAVSMLVPEQVCINDGNVILQADIQVASTPPGIPPYNISWHYNLSGIFNASDPGVLIGNNQIQFFTLINGWTEVYVQLTVVSSDGVEYKKVKKIAIDYACAQGGERGQSSEMFGIQVNPNPNNGYFNIYLHSKEEKSLDFTIFNTLGANIMTKSIELKKGQNSIEFGCILSTGLYFISSNDPLINGIKFNVVN